jgi:hypothetical protein
LTLDKVQSLANESDPCGFIHFGAPIDEYDCFTNQLLSALMFARQETKLKTSYYMKFNITSGRQT